MIQIKDKDGNVIANLSALWLRSDLRYITGGFSWIIDTAKFSLFLVFAPHLIRVKLVQAEPAPDSGNAPDL